MGLISLIWGNKRASVDQCTIWNVYGLKINPREDKEIVNDDIFTKFNLERYSAYYFNEDDNHSQLEEGDTEIGERILHD